MIMSCWLFFNRSLHPLDRVRALAQILLTVNRSLYQLDRLKAFSDIEDVLKEAVRREFVALEDDWLETAVAPIYRKYVQAYFKALGNRDRSSN